MKNTFKNTRVSGILVFLLLNSTSFASSKADGGNKKYLFHRTKTTRISIQLTEATVLKTAFSIVKNDVASVFGADLKVTAHYEEADIIVTPFGARETAYGLTEL